MAIPPPIPSVGQNGAAFVQQPASVNPNGNNRSKLLVIIIAALSVCIVLLAVVLCLLLPKGSGGGGSYDMVINGNPCKYTGEVRDMNGETVAHGVGEAKFENGDYYKGPLVNGRMQGADAYFKSASGDVYEGEYNDNKFYEGKINGHKFVNLGLPSGILWAETNIGASQAADCGDYFGWGETASKDISDWRSYKYGTSLFSLSKYNGHDGHAVLDSIDDAASVTWGYPCRMPTDAEYTELLSTTNCSWTWTSQPTSAGSSVCGYRVQSKSNGHSVFFPAWGCHYRGGLYSPGEYGCYWSASLDPTNAAQASALRFAGNLRQKYNYERYYYSHTVRAVVSVK